MKTDSSVSGEDSAANKGLAEQEVRTCLTCGTRFSAGKDSSFCPVCALRDAANSQFGSNTAEDATTGPQQVLSSLENRLSFTRFENYELIFGEDGRPIELGRGAMGITYKGFDVDLRVPVTLKVIVEKYVGDESARLRFLREARAAARLRHSNVASVLRLGRSGQDYFYAMEFVEGETLEKLIKREAPLERLLALEIISQVAAGLSAIHKEKLVHRDIKPTNIMVNIEKGGSVAVKIIDLGLAKAISEPVSEDPISALGAFAGTPEFASPEQFAGLGLDIRSDLYSLGVTFWEMLTGQLPFSGSAGDLMHKHLHNNLPLEQLKDVPQPIVALVEKLLQKDPARRPQDPGQLEAQLRRLKVVFEPEDLPGKGSFGALAEWKKSRSRKKNGRFKLAILLLLMAAAVLSLVLPKYFSPVANIKSVAVLPFADFSNSKVNPFFGEGLTSEVIFQLSKVVDLRVISRQSVLRYRDGPVGRQKSLSEIGRELNVATILESSVERLDNRVKIITILFDARTNKRLWGASYDREMEDIFAIQSDVAEQIATALQATLSIDERVNIHRKPTESLAAYDLYLRGWGLYQLYGQDENEQAIALFKQALETDPKFALAYTGLADAYIERVERFRGEDFWSDSAIDLCQQAVSLDPKEVRGYTELARAFLNKGWGERAHQPILKALELNSNDWRANRFAAEELFGTGRYDQIYFYLRKCFDVNPNDSYAPNLMSYICWFVDENELAEKWLERAISVEIDPQSRLLMECERSVFRGEYAAAVPGLQQLPKGFYGYAYSASGLLIDCLVHLKDWPALLSLLDDLQKIGDTRKGRDPATLLISRAMALRALGHEAEAIQTALRCENLARDHLATKKFDPHWNHWILAFCSRFLGRQEEAYQQMQASFVNGDVSFLGWLPDGPSLQIFKPDAEFQSIVAERNKKNSDKRFRIRGIEKNYR